MKPILWITVSAISFAFGEYFSKYYAMWHAWQDLVALFVCYNIGVACWLPAINETKELAIIGSIWSVMSLAATVLIGVFLFKEHIDVWHWVGIGLAALSVTLLAR